MTGWIKLHREITENCLWKSKEPYDKRSAWIDLLLMANYKDFKTVRKMSLVERKRGEVNTSVLYLSERWGWSRNKVYRFLELLKEDGMIHTSGTTDGTTITIENYEKYQVSETTDGTTTETTTETTDGTTNGTHDKKVKKDKKEKNINTTTLYKDVPDKLREVLIDFEEMRKSIKKPMTDRARTVLVKKLNELANGDIEMQIQIVEQSILNSWQGVYELKERNNEQGKNNTRRSPKVGAGVAGRVRDSEASLYEFKDAADVF